MLFMGSYSKNGKEAHETLGGVYVSGFHGTMQKFTR